MPPFYDLNQISTMPLVEDYHDQSHIQYPFATLPVDHTSSVPCSIFFNISQFHGQQDEDHLIGHNFNSHGLHRQHQQQFTDQAVIQESSNFPVSLPERSICDQQAREEDQMKSSKWMSSKMRIMRKMMNPDGIATKKPRRRRQQLQDPQGQNSSSSNNNNSPPSDGVVRVCSDCNTTKTPLWRSGPSGPKSLCNACGIRQRKARRALAAAAAVNGALVPTVPPKEDQEDKELDVDRTVPFKKRCRFSSPAGVAQKKLCFDDIVISLSKSSAFHRVFPQDEKDAAILLMALSCGLMCS